MEKILVANRGEIAVRIMKTAREMNILTVAVFSEVDRKALHVRSADEAVCIGGASSTESYLKMDSIIEAALNTGADAIHPGYGFLSENANFAQKVEEAGLIFIGPGAESMKIMGSKLAAKEAVSKYNVPLVPGGDKPIGDIKAGKEIALEIGYPILIKASAGGGGKGMRIVHKEEEFESQLKTAISEAKSAFGDGSVFIEKFVTNPRHIEIQILADKHGNTVYLNERECSIQRRHQKVIEEAPSSIINPQLRYEMGEAAVHVAKSCNYVGAGTVEFIMNDKKEFYFLEMNTRLQVEHPVTEMTTGVDMVEEQILIAQGEHLRFNQEDVTINGHSIELRVYAEDPENNFLPDVGTLEVYQLPEMEGVRVDNGYEEGMEIPIYYDPMISKLVVHAEDRKAAIDKMKLAIEHYRIEGVKNTLPFGLFVMKHPRFISGDFDTNFIDSVYKHHDLDRELMEAAAIASLHFYNKRHSIFDYKEDGNLNETSRWADNRREQ